MISLEVVSKADILFLYICLFNLDLQDAEL